MFRPKASGYLLLSMLVAAAASTACSSPNAQEENIVRQYFRASGLRDNQTLANFAVVSFDPKTEGAVTDFDVTSVSEERSEPLRIIELQKAFSEAESANKAFNEKKKTYQDANIEAINRVIKAQASGAKLSGRDGQVQAEWEKWQAETGAEAKKLSAAREAFNDSRPVAELSLTTGTAAPPAIEDTERRAQFEGCQHRRHRARARWRDEPEELRRDVGASGREGRQRRPYRQVDRNRRQAGVEGQGLGVRVRGKRSTPYPLPLTSPSYTISSFAYLARSVFGPTANRTTSFTSSASSSTLRIVPMPNCGCRTFAPSRNPSSDD